MKQVHVRLTDEDYQRLVEMADRERRSLSNLAALLVVDGMDRRDSSF